MNRPVKILLGLLAVLPLALTTAAIWAVYQLLTAQSEAPWNFVFSIHPLIWLFFNLFLMVLTYGPNIFYIIHAGRNPDLADRRVIWILLIVFVGVFVMPLYWYLFVWHESYYET